MGKGKKLFGNASGLLDKIDRRRQLAGVGSLRSTYFSLPASYWNFTGEPVHIYDTSTRSRTAAAASASRGYLWWNGTSGQPDQQPRCSGKPNGYMGIPAVTNRRRRR